MIHWCECCNERQAIDWHHRFSKSKANLKKYGAYLIHHPWNGIKLCRQCHDKVKPKWSEREFIQNMGLTDYCKKKLFCKSYKKYYPQNLECSSCREYEFNKEFYYKDKDIKENKLIHGSFGYKE